MEFFKWICLVHCLIATELPWTCWGLSVRFLYEDSIYVALDRTLVLEAHFEKQSGENIRLVTWDRRTDSKEIRLVTNDRATDARISVEKDRAMLKLTGVRGSDYGLYVVTVTDGNGDQTYASVEVRSVQVPPVAVMYLECSMLTEGAQWDSPVFSWWADGVEVAANGSRLLLSGSLANNYTCIVDSGQGTSSVQTFLREPAPKKCPEPESCTGLIAAVIVVPLILLTVIGVLVWKCKRKGDYREARRDQTMSMTTNDTSAWNGS